MKLSIISLKGIELDADVSSLNLKTTSGEITVMDNHRPMITELSSGQAVVVKKDGEIMNFKIASGFLEVSGDNKVNLLVN